MTIQEMRQRKRELGYSNEVLSALSGVPLGTIMKIFGGATKSPRRATIEALEKVLRPEADRQGSFFQECCFRKELIDGVFYHLPLPSVSHQLIVGELFLQLKACEKKHNGKCRVILSPFDVWLDQDRRTIVQPDLLVVCDPEKLKEKNCSGAPDLVIEVLSPSSRSHDCVLKLNTYKNAGVREYWIVDPEHCQVITYSFSGEGSSSFETFRFTDIIPVHILEGGCTVDMNAVLHLCRELENYE